MSKNVNYDGRKVKHKKTVCGCFNKTKTRVKDFGKNKYVKVNPLEYQDNSGLLEFSKNTNVEMWRKIIDDSIIGTKLIDKVCICIIGGHEVIVCNPSSFVPSLNQMKTLINGFEDSEIIQRNGFKFVTDVFELVESDERHIIGAMVGKTGGIALFKTNLSIIIGLWTKNDDEATNILKEIRTKLGDEGL